MLRQQINYRPFQREAIDASLAYMRNTKNPKSGAVAVLPTAAGKSFVIAGVVAELKAPVLVLQPSEELLIQNLDKLNKLGVNASVCCSGLKKRDISNLTYATLGSIKGNVAELKKLGIKHVIVDECHFGYPPDPGSMFMKFIKQLAPLAVLGLTATPFRLKQFEEGSKLNMLNRAQPAFFRSILHVTQIHEMVSGGFWSQMKYQLYTFDESGLIINSSGSDYSDKSISEALYAQGINNNIYLQVRRLQKEAYYKSILVFVESVEVAEKLASTNIRNATFIHSGLKDKERQERVEGFKNGKYEVMFNYGILTTGFDYPDLRCVIMGRPTLSLTMVYQIFGRGTRISAETGKVHCLFIDFCGNIERFGPIENIVIYNEPKWGWGAFSSGYILTNRFLNLPLLNIKNINADGSITKMYPQYKLDFGQYSGQFFEDVPSSYLRFLLSGRFISNQVRKDIEGFFSKKPPLSSSTLP